MDNNCRILLIEDDPADAMLITELLNKTVDFPHKIEQRLTLSSALKALRELEFDIILSDMGLPDSKGYQTFEKVSQSAHDTPVIILTHLSDEDIAMKAMQNNAQDYLFKTGLTTTFLVKAIKFALVRHSLSKALKESESKAKVLIDAIPDMMFKLSRDGEYLDYKAATNDLADQTQSIIGKKIREITTTEFADLIDEKIILTLQTGQMQKFEYQLPIPSQGIIEFEARMVASGTDEIIAIVRNITKQKQAEAEIKHKNEELLKANAEKDKFFSIIAHDLRSPFNGFLGLTKIMADDLPSLTLNEIQEISVSMRNSANNLFGLLENLLEWSQMRRGKTSFKPELLVLKSAITEIMQFVSDVANKKGVEIRYEIPYGLKVYADLNMIGSTIRNLTTNAVKFTTRGGKITIAANQMPNSFVEISIKDTGIGMNKEIMDNLFFLDKQTNRRGTDDEPSTGLGLMLCKEFIEKHGGKIWVESMEGNGSTFRFTIPGI